MTIIKKFNYLSAKEQLENNITSVNEYLNISDKDADTLILKEKLEDKLSKIELLNSDFHNSDISDEKLEENILFLTELNKLI